MNDNARSDGSILYIVTTNVTSRPIIVAPTESELKTLHADLCVLDATENGGLEILDTQRCVISASGKVIYTRVWLTFDQHGLEIHDVYRNLLDSYYVPARTEKRFVYRYTEMWQKTGEIAAESLEDAEAKLETMRKTGALIATDGDLVDSYYEAWQSLRKEN